MQKIPAGSLRFYRGFLLLIVSGLIFNSTISDAHGQNFNPELLTYQELVQLYEQPAPAEPLQRKLTALLNTPFVSNAATQRGTKPLKPQSPILGQFLRVAFWNIERGLQYDAVAGALGGARDYTAMLHRTKLAHSSSTRVAAAKEAAWKSFGSDPEWIEGKAASEVDGTLVVKLTSVLMECTDYAPQL